MAVEEIQRQFLRFKLAKQQSGLAKISPLVRMVGITFQKRPTKIANIHSVNAVFYCVFFLRMTFAYV